MDWSERHDLIKEQAAQLFATKGIAATTVRDIADGVGILSGSLYHYFRSKDAIADMIVTRYLDDLTREYQVVLDSPNDPRTRLAELVKASFRVSLDHPHASEIYRSNSTYLNTLPSHNTIHEGARTIRTCWLDVIETGISEGTFRSDLPVDLLYRLIRDAVWLSFRSLPAEDFDPSNLADSVVSVFMYGIQANTRKSDH